MSSNTAKRTIGFVFDDSLDKPDGVQQYVLILSRWLAAQGHDVHYLVGETKRTDIANLHSLSRNIHVRFNQNRMAMPLPAKRGPISELLQDVNFDVLHVQVPYSPFLAGRIIKLASPTTAVVGTFHIAGESALVVAANKVLGLWVRSTLRRFDAMVAAPAAADFAKRTCNIGCSILPLPVALKNFYGTKPFERYAKGKTVVYLGRFVERKGCRYLLQAVSYAVKHGMWPSDARVVLCGGGPLEASLKSYAAEQGLEQIVSFEGYISEEDKPRYLASADVVTYPSTGGEGFGVVLLEAMAASPGIVLAGNNPGYAGAMGDHADQLFDPFNTAAFAERLVAALGDGPGRKAAHTWQLAFAKQCDVPVVGRQTLDMYEQAIMKRRSN
ncbi:MAG TPA: glycosyltransferase family 4 protein [Bacillota bacterium]|nr:glycosyltransferase family 4 protein [Bacillota bacterium]